MWLYAEEWGDVEHVACLVRQFLLRFRPDRCWSLTYSCTCSKLRVGEFGGGAVFVTADEVKYQHADGFVVEQRLLFDRRTRRPGDDVVASG